MKNRFYSFFVIVLFAFLLTACSKSNESSFEHPSEEIASTYYSHLQKGDFEQALRLIDSSYLNYIGYTERDFIHVFKNEQTLNGWAVTKIEIRSSDKITGDINVPPQLQPLLTDHENYLVILDLEIKSQGETIGVVDQVLVSTDDNDEWKIFGIVSY
jgi:hypothetical protein